MKKILAVALLLGAGSCGFRCVARGARIRVPKGTRPIEELGAGDAIVCVDPDTGQQVVAQIVATRSAKRECVRLVTADTELILTSDHPVYCPETRQWAPAGDWALEKRSRLLQVTTEGVAVTRVTQAFTFSGIHEVFDLSVDHPLHNFVANGLLVHNKKPPLKCTLEGQPVSPGAACACPGGAEGKVDCSTDPAPSCACPDAGALDGG